MNTLKIKEINSRAIHQASTISEKLGPNEIHDISKEFPFYGYVDVRVGKDCNFVMFSNNDDLVARHYLWNGNNSYETTTLKLWKALAEKSKGVIDVGTYTGVFSLTAAMTNPSIKVFAFEALDRAYNRLQVNKLVNNAHRIVTFNRAVSNECGFVEFKVFVGENVLTTGSSLFDSELRNAHEVKQVQAVTLDSMHELSHCDLVKIDAEGAEHLVLQGGYAFFKTNKPDIIMEVLQSAHIQELSKFFEDTGYNFYSLNDLSGSITQINTLIPSKSMDQLNTLVSLKSLQEIKELLND